MSPVSLIREINTAEKTVQLFQDKGIIHTSIVCRRKHVMQLNFKNR